MKIISFLFSLLLFLAYLLNHRDKREEETQQIIIEKPQEEEKALKGDFYTERLNTLNKMLLAAREEEQKEQTKLNHFNRLNQYGIVVNDKNLKRVKADLYKAQRKRLSIESQIYLNEKRREGEK